MRLGNMFNPELGRHKDKRHACSYIVYTYMGVSQIRGTLLGVPIIRTIVFGVYIGVPLFWETTIYLGPKVGLWERVWAAGVYFCILHYMDPYGNATC